LLQIFFQREISEMRGPTGVKFLHDGQY